MTDILGRLTATLADRYRIERELGQGGMATVYLAHDVRHDRHVALKVLRPELAAILGGERFLKEIRLTANLQHPHILALHDSGEADGVIYYVMPFVEGESLRSRIEREKQLPVDEAVRIARDVAGALDYAHRHGVVHRDIKPENILMHEGQALVADFGIALAASRSDGGSRMTETGMSLGTPHYMAPEQAMGERDITPKADVYALGCVLYEMLTGEPPFTGPTAQAIVARVMTEQPRRLTIQRRSIPPHVEAAVEHALEKLPADRFASAAEFSTALGNPSFATAATMSAAAHAAGPPYRRPAVVVPWLVALAAAAVAAWVLLKPAPPELVTRSGLALPATQEPLPDRRFSIAPNGSRLAYVGPGGQIWVKERAAFAATLLPGTLGVTNFTFSPDGSWIAFAQGGQLKKMPVIGGAAITLADSIGGNAGLAWLTDGSIIYIGFRNNTLLRVPEVGGPSTLVWRSDTGTVRFPIVLPGARGLLFTRCLGAGCRLFQDIWGLDLRSGQARLVQTGATLGLYAPSGHLLYVRRDGAMFAVPFDAGALALRGAPVPVLDSITVVNDVFPLIALSGEGTMVIRPGASSSSGARYHMTWVDRTGLATPVDSSWLVRLTLTGNNVGWALSPDGRGLAIGLNTDAGDDIWIKQLPDGPLSRVSFDSAADFRPRWSADGRSVTYLGRGTQVGAALRRRSDATNAEETLLDLGDRALFEYLETRDGRYRVMRLGGTVGQAGNRDLFVQQIGTDSAPRPLIASPVFDEAAAALSPDGRWIAYETNETGRTEVYVRPFPDVDAGKWQISTNGGVAPVWARNGRELFFVNGDRDMVAVGILPGATLRVAERRTLFHLGDELYLANGENYTPFDISPDGRRFMMARRYRVATTELAPLVVTENWFAELKQRLGGR